MLLGSISKDWIVFTWHMLLYYCCYFLWDRKIPVDKASDDMMEESNKVNYWF